MVNQIYFGYLFEFTVAHCSETCRNLSGNINIYNRKETIKYQNRFVKYDFVSETHFDLLIIMNLCFTRKFTITEVHNKVSDNFSHDMELLGRYIGRYICL